MSEYSPSKKGMESERNISLTLSSINPEILFETKKNPTKFSRLDFDSGYTGNRYLLWVSLHGKLKGGGMGASYWIHGNTYLPENTKYNTQC